MLLREYVKLIRLPNVFTAPPDVLAGYFSVVPPSDANAMHLAGLMVSSAFLYIAGIVFNDYFDIESDRRERPSRPLPSGSVKREHALVLAISALAAGNIVSLVTAGPGSLAVSAALSAIILAYDYRLKATKFGGSIAMGGARFLNVILGASPVVTAAALDQLSTSLDIQTMVLASGTLFVYVVSIMILSRKEIEGADGHHRIASISIVLAVIATLGILGYTLQFQPEYVLFLSAFAGVVVLTFWRHLAWRAASSQSTQATIKNMVLSIILLDSVIVSGTSGVLNGLSTLLFLIPAIILGKKMYVT